MENYQWKVTDDGLETQAGQVEYAISAASLFETCVCDGEAFFAPLIEIMGRDWVIRDDILEIYPQALAHHAARLKRVVDETVLTRSLAFYRENDTWLKARAVKARMGKGGMRRGRCKMLPSWSPLPHREGEGWVEATSSNA